MAKSLYRSKSNRRIAGICGGLAEYFDVDANILRILWIASCFVGTLGIWLYLIAWLILPEK